MIISHEKPPIFEDCVKAFGITWDEGIAFTYGDTVFCKNNLTTDLLVHESVHVKQQASYFGGSEYWWKKYIEDKDFRLSQEVEAYKSQLEWYKRNIKDRNTLFKAYNSIWNILSGPMYGNMITASEAARLLPYKH